MEGMDLSLIAQATIAVLGPLVGQLFSVGGEKAVEAAAGKFGEGMFERAKAALGKLGKKAEAKPGAPEAARAVAETPDDTYAQAELVLHLKKILAADPDLAAELEQIVRKSPAGNVMIATATDRSAIGQGGGAAAAGGGIAIGGNVYGGARFDRDEEGGGGKR
ncbi:MAG: hypothetical protein ABJC13_10195 [Acidobacteriota bacterium]